MSDVEVSKELPTMEAVRSALWDRMKTVNDKVVHADPEDAMVGIIGEIMGGTSVNDILSGGTTTGAEEILGEPILINGDIRFLEGDFGTPFAVFSAVNQSSGEVYDAISCGGEIVCVQLLRMMELDAVSGDVFPALATFVQKRTRQGYDVLRLTAVGSAVEVGHLA